MYWTNRARNFRRMMFETLANRINFATTYYIDPLGGDDNNNGTSEATAYKTPSKLVSQYAHLQPTGHVQLQPGDSIVLMPGKHDFAYRYADIQWQGLFLRNVHGTAEQPITIRALPGTIIDNRAPDGSEMSSLYLLQSSHFVIEGLDVSAHGSAVSMAEANYVVFRNNYVHSASGSAYDNLSGLYLSGVSNIRVENNLFMDNYDRERPGNQNNRQIVLFGCTNTYIIGNTLINSAPNVGLAVDYKHLGGLPANATGIFEVAYNKIVNANGNGIGTSAPNSYIHHNLLIDSGGIRVADFGGTNQLANERIEYNTIVNSIQRQGSGSLEYNPNEYPGYPLGQLSWNKNVVVDNRSYDNFEQNTFLADRYGSDEFFRRVFEGGLFSADGNLYDTRDPARFDLYAVNGGTRGVLGDMFSFPQWQARGYDRNGAAIDLGLDPFYRTQVGQTPTAGIYAGDQPRLTAIVERIHLTEHGENSSVQLRLVRSNGSLGQALQVNLRASRSGEIRMPTTATFPAGSDTAIITIEGIADLVEDPQQAIQIEVAAAGWRSATAWVVLEDSPSPPQDPLVNGIFQVPGTSGQHQIIQAVVQDRWAEYNNELGFALVDDATGRVGQLLPGEPGWITALMSRSQHQVLLRSGAIVGDSGQATVPAGHFFVFYLVQDASTQEWLQNNSTNQTGIRPLLFTSVAQGNHDRFDHVRETQGNGMIDLAWEDLEYGGDMSFRDLVVRTTFTADVENYCQAVDLAFDTTAEAGAIALSLFDNHQGSANHHVARVTQPEFGTVEIAALGNQVIFTPANQQYGTAHFSYTLNCGDTQSTAQIQVDVQKKWTNSTTREDVNGDNQVTPLDALLVINVLNNFQPTQLESYPQGDQAHWAMVDVNADGVASAIDALLVILHLL